MIWIWSYCIKIKLVVNKLVVEEGEVIESKMCQYNCEKQFPSEDNMTLSKFIKATIAKGKKIKQGKKWKECEFYLQQKTRFWWVVNLANEQVTVFASLITQQKEHELKHKLSNFKSIQRLSIFHRSRF